MSINLKLIIDENITQLDEIHFLTLFKVDYVNQRLLFEFEENAKSSTLPISSLIVHWLNEVYSSTIILNDSILFENLTVYNSADALPQYTTYMDLENVVISKIRLVLEYEDVELIEGSKTKEHTVR